ncbi:hypothetical protein [Mycoplasma suis]|nr:hypothetical protein [Mycoplasma suis]
MGLLLAGSSISIVTGGYVSNTQNSSNQGDILVKVNLPKEHKNGASGKYVMTLKFEIDYSKKVN